MDSIESVLIAVPTYNRPQELVAFLSSALPQMRAQDAMVVVDNAPDAEAHDALQAVKTNVHIDLVYCHEPTPGIAAARNAGLRHLELSSHDAIIFVDDDEIPHPNWLHDLVNEANGLAAGVVYGPVVSILPPDAPRWLRRGRFFQRDIPANPEHLWTAPSNNTLLKTETWVAAGKPMFDSAFSFTGGSDTDFFARLVDSGAVVHFCKEAVVFEPVPSSRMRLSWLLKRGLRMGQVNYRTLRPRVGSLQFYGHGLVTSFRGLVSLAFNLLVRFRIDGPNLNRVLYGLGALTARFGAGLQEYRRSS